MSDPVELKHIIAQMKKFHKTYKGGSFWSDFVKGFKQGFEGTLKLGLPIVADVAKLALAGGEPCAGGKPKVKKCSSYNQFVKENIGKMTGVLPKDRMKAVAKLWREQK